MSNARHLGASVLLITALSALAGCVSVSAYPLHAPPRPMRPLPVSAVEVYVSQRPARPYVEVSLLESREWGMVTLDDRAAVIDEIRSDAARRGCDGVILLGPADQVTERSGHTETDLGYQAVCFVYVPGGPVTAAAR